MDQQMSPFFELLSEPKAACSGCLGGWADGGDADPGPDPGECQGEPEDPEAGPQEVPQPHTIQGQSSVKRNGILFLESHI